MVIFAFLKGHGYIYRSKPYSPSSSVPYTYIGPLSGYVNIYFTPPLHALFASFVYTGYYICFISFFLIFPFYSPLHIFSLCSFSSLILSPKRHQFISFPGGGVLWELIDLFKRPGRGLHNVEWSS
jgi:hypothetical protein